MKLKSDRLDKTGDQPTAVTEALYVLGHWLATTGPDFNADFNVTEGDEVIQYVLEMREIRRYKWLIEGETNETV